MRLEIKREIFLYEKRNFLMGIILVLCFLLFSIPWFILKTWQFSFSEDWWTFLLLACGIFFIIDYLINRNKKGIITEEIEVKSYKELKCQN